MKRAVIDIGSNSVRILICGDGETYRKKITTRLGEGFTKSGVLSEERINATVSVVRGFFEYSIISGVSRDNIFAFATAACRNAKNGASFIEACLAFGLSVKILADKEECEYALLGALGGKDGAVLDIGGASSELAIAKDKKIDYYFSLQVGAVVMHDKCGEDFELLNKYTDEAVKNYGVVSADKLYAVGGTATLVAHAVIGGEYSREKTHGFFVSLAALDDITKRFFSMNAKERDERFLLGIKRAEVICGGSLLLLKIIKMLNLDGFYVSENDNLEGALYKLDGYGYR